MRAHERLVPVVDKRTGQVLRTLSYPAEYTAAPRHGQVVNLEYARFRERKREQHQQRRRA